MPQRRRVVITGLGVATPIGLGIDAFWESLLEGKSGIRRIEAFDPSGFSAQIAGELPAFKLDEFIPKSYRKSVKVMARDIMIAVVCAYHAAIDAKLSTKCIVDRGESPGPPNVDSTRFGANIGAGLICADLPELAGALSTAMGSDGGFSLQKWGAEGMNNLTPLWLLKFLPNMLACHVTIVHDAQAPSNTITCGEASSHLAIGEAFRTVARGDADVCICGGAESKVNPMALARPEVWGRLNTSDNDHPARASRPFAADRRGMVISEGGGLVIVEALDHARARGARIYAELAGFGAACSTKGWGDAGQDGRGIALAISKALKDALVGADQIDLAAPFGAGTNEHDAAEMSGWKTALGQRLKRISSMTTRGALGNNGAGSGAIDFAAMVMAVHRGMSPPSVNTHPADTECGFRFVQNGSRDVAAGVALSAGYSLAGGQCAALVVKKYE